MFSFSSLEIHGMSFQLVQDKVDLGTYQPFLTILLSNTTNSQFVNALSWITIEWSEGRSIHQHLLTYKLISSSRGRLKKQPFPIRRNWRFGKSINSNC